VNIGDAFTDLYGHVGEGVWHAPGRINLIGEHTDYNGGLVLPFALALGVSAAVARHDDVVEVRSVQAPGTCLAVTLPEIVEGSVPGWPAYVAGVWWSLRRAGYPVGGASVLIDSDLPKGAGLSSSAALECAIALALRDLYELPIDRWELAGLARRAENDFVGVPCGILDQAAAVFCTAGHALLLDCHDGTSTAIPLDLDGLALLVVDTGATHQHLDGGYASRRTQFTKSPQHTS
jgi:galactokinase